MRAAAIAHPNIALIKYWGKRDVGSNLPAVGSLSVTLDSLETRTTVSFENGLANDRVQLNGREASPGECARIRACLDSMRGLAGESRRARVESHNNFPTGAGLASSASGFAALVTAAAAATGLDAADPRLPEIARLGSGSAPRSLIGGFVHLGLSDGGTECRQLLAPGAWPLQIIIAVTAQAPKAVSSRDGMELSRKTSPYYDAWVADHRADLDQAVAAVRRRDFEALAEVSEHSCLKMHAVMLASRPPLIYWLPATLACLQRVRALRKGGLPVFATIDAGPQVKAVCLPEAADAVARELESIDGVQHLIVTGLGDGARRVGHD